jgi:hypothetical protein
MRLRATSPVLAGWEGEAAIMTDCSASSYGLPVLTVEGEPVGTAEAALAGYQVVEGTDDEIRALLMAGYYSVDDCRDSPEQAS